MGPTASGKTALAEALADRLDAILVNADAFQAYRGMDVGTAKPQDKARYRLLDVKSPAEAYGAGEFCLRAAAELEVAHRGGRSAVVVGGTGQYVRALFEEYRDLMPDPDPALRARLAARLRDEGLDALARELSARDPALATRTELRNPVRVTRALERLDDPRGLLTFNVPYTKRVKLATNPGKATLDEAIARRTARMMHNGWVEEVRRLRERGYGPGIPAFGPSATVSSLPSSTETSRRRKRSGRSSGRRSPTRSGSARGCALSRGSTRSCRTRPRASKRPGRRFGRGFWKISRWARQSIFRTCSSTR